MKLLPLYTDRRRRLGPHQQRHLAGHGRRARPDQGADRRGQGARRAADARAAASRTCRVPTAPSWSMLGNHPAERFNHVHFCQEDPFCAQLWYQKHLNAPPVAGRDRRDAADRGHLQGRARPRSHLAGARPARACSATPRAAVDVRRRGVHLVHAPGRRSRSRARAASSTTTSRSASPISTPGSPSCAARASRSCKSPTSSATRAP